MTQANITGRADVLIELGRPGEAITMLSSALATDPQSVGLLCRLSRAYLASDLPQQALFAAQRATAAAPGLEWPRRLESHAYSELNDHYNAARSAAEAVRLAPHEWRTHARLAISSAQAGHTAAGLEAATQAVRLGPDEAGTHFAMGYAAMKAGDKQGAEQAYRRTLAIDPNNAMAMNNLGLIHMKQPGGLNKAMRGFGGALALDAQLPVAQRNLRVLARRYLRRFHYCVFAAYFVVYLGFDRSANDSGLQPMSRSVSGSSRVAAGVVGCVALVVLIAALVQFDRKLPGNLRRYYRRLPLTDRMIGAWLATDTLALVAVSLIAVPATYAGRTTLVHLAWALLLVGVGISWLPRLKQGSRRSR